MTFIILLFVLGGLALILSGVENQSLATYIQSWVGGNATK